MKEEKHLESQSLSRPKMNQEESKGDEGEWFNIHQQK